MCSDVFDIHLVYRKNKIFRSHHHDKQKKSKLSLQATMILLLLLFRNPICRKRIFAQNLYFCHWKEEIIVEPVRIVVEVTRISRNLKDICTENVVILTAAADGWWVNHRWTFRQTGHPVLVVGGKLALFPCQCLWAKCPTVVMVLGSWTHQHCPCHQDHILKWSLRLQKSSWENEIVEKLDTTHYWYILHLPVLLIVHQFLE